MAENGKVIVCNTDEKWKDQLEKAKNSGNLVVVDFTAIWCGPCKFMAPVFAELAKRFPNVQFLKVDVDELKNVAEDYKVEAMPTFVFLKDGKEVEKRIVGANKDALVNRTIMLDTSTPINNN